MPLKFDPHQNLQKHSMIDSTASCRYLPRALLHKNALAEQFGCELTVAVQIRQNSPSTKVTVLEVEENVLPPLVPLHS